MSDHERRNSREIRQSIEATRDRMDATIDALERRLSPRELADHALSWVRGSGGNVADSLRDHPVPLALMGLGVAWLAVEEARSDDRQGNDRGYVGSDARAEGRVGPYRGDAVADHDDDAPGRVRDALESARDGVAHVAHGVGERLHDAAHSARAAGHHAREDAGDAADALRRRSGDIAHGIRSVFDDSPLAVGALSFGIGLAAALTGPSTRVEDRLMGDAANAVKTRAKHAADEVAHDAVEAAAAAVEEVDRQGHELADEARARAQQVAEEARAAVRRSPDEERGRTG